MHKPDNSYVRIGSVFEIEISLIYLFLFFVPYFAGSNPAEAVGFLGRKNPQHAFLPRGSKAVGPM